METSKAEVAAVKQAEGPEYVEGVRALVRSTEPGTMEYDSYRARLDEIDAMARRLMGRKS